MKNTALLTTTLALGVNVIRPKVFYIPKQCLNCGEDSNHNNAFCSTKCCKNYEAGDDPLIAEENERTKRKNLPKHHDEY